MITVHLDSNSVTPLYEQIYQFIKDEIQSGTIHCHSKLPSTRSLAVHLEVSRNTVDMAYSQLLSEGYIEASPKRGYFVNQITELLCLPDAKHAVSNGKMKTKEAYQYRLSPFDLDFHAFPYNTWRKLAKNCLNDDKGTLFVLGDHRGDEELRLATCAYLHESRGVSLKASQIVIGAGVDYLLPLLSEILDLAMSKEIVIGMENPTYRKAHRIFQGLQVNTIPISLDSSGMKIEELNDSAANIAYVTPSHQYPLGIVMPIGRRLELLLWARKEEDHYIIEDDHDSEFRYKGKPIPSLQGLDKEDKVIYIGTFSRSIAPSLRMGYMVLPQKLLDIYQRDFYYYACTVSRMSQNIVSQFIEEGYFERHLNKMRKIYKNKQDTMLQSLKIFGSQIKVLGENAGLHLIVCFQRKESEEELIQKAKEKGILLYGLKEHFIDGPPSGYLPTFLMGYGGLSEMEIKDSITLLYEVFSG